MILKVFEFDKTRYRLELYGINSGEEHKTVLFKHIFGDQKEELSQMLETIIDSASASDGGGDHGIAADVVQYVKVERPVKKANDTITTRTLAEALYGYLERTGKEAIGEDG